MGIHKHAVERRAKVLAIFAAKPDRAFSARDIHQKCMRDGSLDAIRDVLIRMRVDGLIETVEHSRDATTYRLAREAKSA